jgi:hypothetical protein
VVLVALEWQVVMVLTNGLFAPLNSTTTGFLLKAVEALRAKLMVYKFPPNRQDRFLLTTSLKDKLCAVNGSFELLVPQETFLRSYFTYLARVHLAVADRPNWSNKYLSHSQLHNMSTVTYPGMCASIKFATVAGSCTRKQFFFLMPTRLFHGYNQYLCDTRIIGILCFSIKNCLFWQCLEVIRC